MSRNILDSTEKTDAERFEKWTKSITKCPERYGRLTALILNLLDEAKLSEEREAHYRLSMQRIQNDIPHPTFENLHTVIDSARLASPR